MVVDEAVNEFITGAVDPEFVFVEPPPPPPPQPVRKMKVKRKMPKKVSCFMAAPIVPENPAPYSNKKRTLNSV